MSYLVIARKWRPQTFAEIIGQQHVTQTLANAIAADRVAHAFLFTGVRGVGKTTAARVLAKALNCQNGPTADPCNACTNCREITAGSSVDVLEVDGASNTGVDDVREIIENVRYQPAQSRFKIYIIDEVHMLSTSAFNALLKTLEEPPPHVKFIFATTDPHKVPRTIHSRCQRYDFKRIPLRQIAQQLQKIVAADGVSADEESLLLIAREAEGSMRDAQSLLDQVLAFAGKQLSHEDVVRALGLADRRLVRALAGAIANRQPAAAMSALEELYSFGYDLRRLARDLLEYFRDLAAASVAAGSDLLAELPDDERSEITRLAGSVSVDEIDRAFRILLDTEAEIARVPYPKLVFDMAVMKLSSLQPLLSADEILARIDAAAAGAAPQATVGHARSVPPPASAPVPQRSAPPPQAPQAPAARPQASAPAAGEPRTWEGFLAYVRQNKVTLLAYLQSSEVPQIADQMTLVVPPGYYLEYLTQADHRQMVEDLATAYFGRPIAIKTRAAEPAPSAESAPIAKEPSPAELHAEATEHPLVKAAVDILGGEIREVKRRPTTGGRR